MKKLLLFLAFPILGVSAQIEGTWKLAGQAGSLAVGPALNNLTWFSSSLGDVTTRACLFDDSIKFAPGGVMTHYMDGSTWLEAWQGAPEGCGTPVAPHTGGAATYTFDAALGTLTVNGLGAHIGLAKVHNAGELTSPAGAVSTITYNVAFSNGGNTMTAQINFGPGWWQFVYQKTVIINPPTPNITFKVDMSQYTGPAYTGVFVNGTFNGWNGTSNPMSDANLDGVWEATVPIGAGAIEYKFTLDGWNGQEQFVGGETCTVTNGGFTNRSYTVTGDAVLGTVCYNSCTACASNVTFKVDMANYTGAAFTGVFLNGTFNGWCGSCNPMTDANMDGIWDVTLPLPNGAIEYKFTLDGWNGQEQFVGGEPCTVTNGGFTNRSYTVAGVADLGVVCFNTCAACVSSGIEDISSQAVSVYPNPSNGTLAVVANSSAILNNITNIMGETVIALKGNESSINIESLRAGIYFLNFTVKGEIQTIRIIRN
jgi:hypothetical protein